MYIQDQLDKEILKAQAKIDEEKDRKLKKYSEEKFGTNQKVPKKDSCDALLREVLIENFLNE